jgi:hypothetical protein
MNGAVRCPRFDSCSASVCPLDPQWPRAQHLQGERVCGLLTELVKVGGRARVANILTPEQFPILVREWPKVEARWNDIRVRLGASAKTGSRIDAARANFHTPLSGTQGAPLASVSPVPSSSIEGAVGGVFSEVTA